MLGRDEVQGQALCNKTGNRPQNIPSLILVSLIQIERATSNFFTALKKFWYNKSNCNHLDIPRIFATLSHESFNVNGTCSVNLGLFILINKQYSFKFSFKESINAFYSFSSRWPGASTLLKYTKLPS
jgi:hypothetical protein